MFTDEKTCNKCGSKNFSRTENCPISKLMNQNVKWDYCETCWNEDLKIAEKVKATLSKEELAECAKG